MYFLACFDARPTPQQQRCLETAGMAAALSVHFTVYKTMPITNVLFHEKGLQFCKNVGQQISVITCYKRN